MNCLNLIILVEPNMMSILPTLMLLGTIIGVGFLVFYFSKVDHNKDKQLEELHQKLDEINSKLDDK